jgi:hypothetical protein
MKARPKYFTLYFIAGMLCMLLLFSITGAYSPTAGRYQVAAYGANGIGFGAFVVDTQSGDTRLVYLNTGMEAEQRNFLGRAFAEIDVPK